MPPSNELVAHKDMQQQQQRRLLLIAASRTVLSGCLLDLTIQAQSSRNSIGFFAPTEGGNENVVLCSCTVVGWKGVMRSSGIGGGGMSEYSDTECVISTVWKEKKFARAFE
ncbi:hypothetical protein BV898_00893 [Hypsibius exemplaris]|uniref:Uncharacterized protein n=1 Tax=Hypsibius exemplaris TaxID=2072580 RepID=A0A1W0XCI8_HYPEX|nr:hypothetical protein BV898_00893 [Hypsibius exemplaris]